MVNHKADLLLKHVVTNRVCLRPSYALYGNVKQVGEHLPRQGSSPTVTLEKPFRITTTIRHTQGHPNVRHKPSVHQYQHPGRPWLKALYPTGNAESVARARVSLSSSLAGDTTFADLFETTDNVALWSPP